MESSLEKQIENWDILDQVDRNITLNGVLMQNQFSREGNRIYKLAQEKGIIL